MAINNRDLGSAEQRREIQFVAPAAVATGVSLLMAVVPYACEFQAAAFAAIGLSGSPQYIINCLRFTSGGATVIPLGISNITIAAAVGVSGAAQGWSGIRASGNSLVQLQSGDVLALSSAGANTAAAGLAVAFVLKRSADIVSALGLST